MHIGMFLLFQARRRDSSGFRRSPKCRNSPEIPMILGYGEERLIRLPKEFTL